MSEHRPPYEGAHQVGGPRRGPRLRPLGVGEIVDEALDLYRRNFKLLFGVVAIPAIPLFALTAIAFPYLVRLINLSASADRMTDQQAFELLGILGVGAMVFVPVFWIITVVQSAAASLAISDVYLDHPSSVGRILGRVVSKAMPLLGSQLLVATLMVVIAVLAIFLLAVSVAIGAAAGGRANSVATAVVAVIAMIGGGIAAMFVLLAVYVWFVFSTQAVVIEGKSATAALQRSIELVRRTFWRVFGVYFLCLIVVIILAQIVGMVLQLPMTIFQLRNPRDPGVQTVTSVLNMIVQNVVSMLILPFFNGCITMLYYDIRIRKEGFDIEMLSREMGYGDSVGPQFEV